MEAEIVFENADGQLLALLADAVVSEQHRSPAVATEQEVEAGVDVTDHYRAQRDTLSLEVVFSNSPIRPIAGSPDRFWFGVEATVRELELELPPGLGMTRQAHGGPPARGVETAERGGSTVRAKVLQADAEGEVTRTVDSWAMLLAARDEGMIATITTKLRTYESMVLIGADTTISAEDGSWIRCALDFAQIRQVATELVDVVDTGPRNQRGRQQGAQSTKQLTAQEQEDIRNRSSSSLAHNIFN